MSTLNIHWERSERRIVICIVLIRPPNDLNGPHATAGNVSHPRETQIPTSDVYSALSIHQFPRATIVDTRGQSRRDLLILRSGAHHINMCPAGVDPRVVNYGSSGFIGRGNTGAHPDVRS
jgi:hypothetical protein